MFQLQSILEDHERLKESREKKAREKAEKEAKRLAELQVTIGDCGSEYSRRWRIMSDSLIFTRDARAPQSPLLYPRP